MRVVRDIEHDNGLTSRYAHLLKSQVRVGDVVMKGQVIAQVGMSGRTTGPHLHFEVLVNGKAVPAPQPTPKPIEQGRTREPEDALVSVHFEGVLHEGANELRVRYRQTLAKYEMRYGYFTSSTWASAVEYELWPLHEWPLAPDFRLQVEVSFADDTWGPRRVLFGSHYTLELLGYEGIGEKPEYACYRGNAERCAPGRILNGETTYADGIATRRLELDAKFPARLVAIVRQD